MNKLTHHAKSFKATRCRLFPSPALRRAPSRYRQILMRSAASWTNTARAYLELRDIADAYPKGFATALNWLVKDAAIDDEVST